MTVYCRKLAASSDWLCVKFHIPKFLLTSQGGRNSPIVSPLYVGCDTNLGDTMGVAEGCAFLSLSSRVQWWFYIHNSIIKGLPVCRAKVSLSAIGKRGMHQSSYIVRICKAGILKSMPRWLPYSLVAAFPSSALQHGRHWSSNRLCCCCRSYALSFPEFLSGMAFSPQLLLHISTWWRASFSSLSCLCFIIDFPHWKAAK